MKLTTLKTTLDYAKSFLATQDFIAVLQHFAFDKETVVAYNDVAACKLQLPTNLSCTIPGNLLLRLLNTLSVEDVEIEETSTKTNVTVSAGRSKNKLPMLPLEDFVFKLPELDEKPITVAASLIDGIKKNLANVSTNPTRPEFNGINLIIESTGLTLYSSDGYSVSRYRLNDSFSIPSTDQVQCILPAFFCEKLASLHAPLAGHSADILMQFSKQWVTAELANNQLFTRVIDKKAPPCENIIDKFCPDFDEKELWTIPDELESIVNRAILFLDQQAGITTTQITVDGDEVEFKTTSNIGTSHDVLQIPVELGKFSFSVDPNLLLRGFKICDKMTLKPNVILMHSENFLHLIATK